MLEYSPQSLSLKEASALSGYEVAIDGRFETLGFLIDSLEGMLTFLEDERFLSRLRANTKVAAVITTRELASSLPPRLGVGLCDDPRRCFFQLQNRLAETGFYGFTQATRIDPSARIHSRAAIAEVGVAIGPNVIVGANAVVESGSRLLADAVIQAGAVIGAQGFQTLRREEEFIEMSHAGGVVVEKGAVVFSNATIARGLFRQETRIGTRSRVGNNAFVSHNVVVGSQTFVGHGAVINGNSRIGRDCWLGPGVVVANGVCLGDKAFASLGAVIIGDLEADARVSGNFAVPHQRFLRQMARSR